MSDDGQEPEGGRKRRRSEKRKTLPPFPLRLLPEERAAILAAADQAGLTMGSYIRSCIPQASKTRARRLPSVAIVAIAGLQNELNKIGSNIHQLLRHVNLGRLIDTDGEVAAAFAGYQQGIAAILALRRQYEPPPLAEPESEPELEPTL